MGLTPLRFFPIMVTVDTSSCLCLSKEPETLEAFQC
jgi:hypothetical protein